MAKKPMDHSALEAISASRAQPEAFDVQSQLEASAYWQQCEREVIAEREAQRIRVEEDQRQRAAEARKDMIEHRLTEGLEIATSIAAGALGSWRTSGGFAIGDTLNGVIGIAAKAGSVIDPELRPLRAAVRAGKVFLHSEISMITRNMIEKNK